jgi:PKD repeat protein
MKLPSFSKVFLLFIALALIISPSFAFSGSGAGTAGDPYQITTYTQWNEIDSASTACYKLMNDIDFSGQSYDTGISQSTFGGTLYGNNKTISNVIITATGTTVENIGLFGAVVAGSATEGVQDLIVKNVDISSSYTPDTNCYMGVIAGLSSPYSSAYTVRHTYIDSDCSVTYTGGNFNGLAMGGVIGYSSNAQVAYDVFSQAALNTGTADDAAYSAVAGILGRVAGASKSIAKYSGYAGVITTEYTEKEGIVGEPTDAKSSTSTDCFWDTEVSTTTHSPTGTGKTTAQMLTQSTFTNWDFTNIWDMSGAVSEWNGYPVFIGMYIPPPPVADFTSDVTSGASPLTINFVDLSTENPTSWNWSFGDGTYSNTQNCSHTYTTTVSKTYDVNLTATNDGGTDSEIKTGYITAFVGPTAYFNVSPVSGVVGTVFNFTDLSTNWPTAFNWSFGDGVFSTLQNPTHTYAAPGVYDVSLFVSNPAGSSTYFHPGAVNVTWYYAGTSNITFDKDSYIKGENVTVTWNYELDPTIFDVIHIYVLDEDDPSADYYSTIYHYQFANDGTPVSNSTIFRTVVNYSLIGDLGRSFDMRAVLYGEQTGGTSLSLLSTSSANSTFDFPELTNYYTRDVLFPGENPKFIYSMGSTFNGINRVMYPNISVSLYSSAGTRLEIVRLPIGGEVDGTGIISHALVAGNSFFVIYELCNAGDTPLVFMDVFSFSVEDPIVAGTINWFTDSGEVRTTGTVDETINFGLDTGNPGVYHGYRNIGVLLYWYNTASKQWEQEPSSYVNWIESESRSDIDNEHGYDYVVGRIYGSGTFKPLKEGKYKLLLYGKQTALTEAETIATSPELNVDENYLSPGWIISTGDEIFGLGTTGSAAGGGFGWLMGGIICIIMVFLPVVVFRRVDGIVTLIMFGLGVIISTALNLFPLWIIFVLALIGVLYVLWGGIGQGSLGRGGGGEAKVGDINVGKQTDTIRSGDTVAFFDDKGQLKSSTLLPGGGNYQTSFPVYSKAKSLLGNGKDKDQEI